MPFHRGFWEWGRGTAPPFGRKDETFTMNRLYRVGLLSAALIFPLVTPGCAEDNEKTAAISGKTDTSAPPTSYTQQSRGGRSDMNTGGGKAYPGAGKPDAAKDAAKDAPKDAAKK